MKKSIIESRYFTVLLHVLIWSTFFILQILSYQSSMAGRPVRLEEFGPDRFYYRFIFQSSIILIIYYLNSQLLIPKFLFKNKIWKYFISLIVVITVINLLDTQYNNYFEYRRDFMGKKPPITLFISIFIIAVSTSIKLAQKWIENESNQKAMIHEKVNSELTILKAQVNPHFLFNTLNGIYSLANSKSDKTASAIVKLSQLMRYMLDESKQQFVPLSSELDYINTFIDLQKLRLFENVKTEFSIEGNPDNIKIQPLLLIPFIENAFKHGTDSSNECIIKIDLDIKTESIQLIVTNDILKSRKDDGNSGFGLSNIRRRLDLEYPEKYILSTDVIDNRFVANLQIKLL
ncbi:MAG TPA: hypothetical protein DCG75_05840 [Bacteroidales bacterium]|nr:hypothetical protein [Bacteroidales bacterium]